MKTTNFDYIETNKYSYIEISHRIHERPELGNEEIFASRTLIDRLKEHDFEIETEIAGHATGFIATYDSGLDGPAIGFSRIRCFARVGSCLWS